MELNVHCKIEVLSEKNDKGENLERIIPAKNIIQQKGKKEKEKIKNEGLVYSFNRATTK